MNALATFLHISDLHIGEIDPHSGDAAMSAIATQLMTNSPWLDGLLGHHGLALKELAHFVDQERRRAPELAIIVTGDLSRLGAKGELELARKYLHGKIDLTPGRHQTLIGLNMGERVRCIPGNHDHWGGRLPWGGTPSHYSNVIGPCSAISQHALSNGGTISFLSINTDADVGAFSSNRQLAIGAFQSELSHLQSLLDVKRDDEIRILLLHHSWHQTGHVLRMADASRAALIQFIAANQISAMLCGHSHKPLRKFIDTGSGNQSWHVCEVRAGTATQHDVVPLSWKTWWNSRPARSWPSNTLCLHRLLEHPADHSLHWESSLYQRRIGGFRLVKPPQAFPL